MENLAAFFTNLEISYRHWHTRYALFISEILVIIVVSTIFNVLGLDSHIKLIIYVVMIITVFLIWLYTNRLPRTPKNKIGFLICISTGKEIEPIKIKEDFVIILHELIKQGVSGRWFHVITVPEYVADKIIDQDDAERLRLRCNAHFVIYGRVHLRLINSKEKYVLNLKGIVATRQALPKSAIEDISSEFKNFFPPKLIIEKENDIFSFSITSEWVNCVARYIIGIIAYYADDFDYAVQLYKDVADLLKGKDQAFPVFAKLKQRIPLRMAEINQAQTRIAYYRWVKTRETTYIKEIGNYLKQIPDSVIINSYGLLILKSIYLFLEYRDIKKSKELLKKCKNNPDGTWLYNLAFLEAYSGNLQSATKSYKKLDKFEVEPHVIAQVEEFISWVLEQESDMYQLYYCLGFINWKLKGDNDQAIEDFKKFLSKCHDDDKFLREQEMVQKWLSEIENDRKEEGEEEI